jgi:hypothetical protein
VHLATMNTIVSPAKWPKKIQPVSNLASIVAENFCLGKLPSLHMKMANIFNITVDKDCFVQKNCFQKLIILTWVKAKGCNQEIGVGSDGVHFWLNTVVTLNKKEYRFLPGLWATTLKLQNACLQCYTRISNAKNKRSKMQLKSLQQKKSAIIKIKFWWEKN